MKRVLILAIGMLATACVWASPSVEIQTSMGRIVVSLDSEKAPKTVENFLTYVRAGFYGGTVFHRVIPGFMIQGGGFTPDMTQKATRASVENEARNGLRNRRGSVAMARTAHPHSATAQFFINLVDNASLDYPSPDGWGYAVFGEVAEGMDVVDRIAAVETGSKGGHRDVPGNPVIIKTVKVIPENEKEK
ncbi:MAG: peptidyl-prolyl cis-trans isomerase [Zoogloeaceae bacterium]|jgi:peptidyl-prolyl cis-trans isomerase A (cyclophilin A)|nr:peptidyl-prolyl cis-trans isomerase [Zoogloeaceae bacterium]